MKLKEHMNHILELVNKHPEALEMEVVASRDDEGNGFAKVHYKPSVGRFQDGEYDTGPSVKEQLNAVCLN